VAYTLAKGAACTRAIERVHGMLTVMSAPFGWRDRPRYGGIERDESEQATLSAIRDVWERDAFSIRGLRDWLNDHGFRNRRGQAFTATSVARILRAAFDPSNA
jgi:hypothetical protein